MDEIRIKDAYEGNLNHIDVNIPRNQFVVFCGVSGCGKSTLLIDVLYQECQRQYLEAISFQGINKAKVDAVENAGACILIGQEEYNQNPRSTLGTMSDIYSELRMLYEKLGQCQCKQCGDWMDYATCKEEFVKKGNDYEVYVYCPHCNTRQLKLTRSHFSFNTQEGACPTCMGLGVIQNVNLDAIIQNQLTIEQGAILGWSKNYAMYQIDKFKKTCKKKGIRVDVSQAIENWDSEIYRYFIEGTDDFEGVKANFLRRYQTSKKIDDLYKKAIDEQVCFDCCGSKLNNKSRSVVINGLSISEVNDFSISQLLDWVQQLKYTNESVQNEAIIQYILNMENKLKAIQDMGLGYLQLNRQTRTLSRGEKQRIKLSAALQSLLSGMIYILDEPTVGLHPNDTMGVIYALKTLRDRGNSVFVIEHDKDIIENADYIIELGKDAGRFGANVVFCGTREQLLENKESYTAQYLRENKECNELNANFSSFYLKNACAHNIHGLDVTFQKNAINVITGVSGAGKSTLLFTCLVNHFYEKNNRENRLVNCEQFDALICVDQKHVSVQKRSLVATYCGVYDAIRSVFAKLEMAKQLGLTLSSFSFNTSNKGRCERCEGLGVITSAMLFFKDVETPCPVCHGKRFSDEILQVKYQGYSIYDVLNLSVQEALVLFAKEKKVTSILKMLEKIGLNYLVLSQMMTTLSTGEKQRLKLSMELLQNHKKHCLYVVDEPTTGLHPKDIHNLIVLFKEIQAQGNTLLLIEHNLQLIKQCDYVIDLGEGGGSAGGKIIAQGSPYEVNQNAKSSLYGLL